MTIATDAQIQAKLDASDGRGVRIVRSIAGAAISGRTSRYVVPVVSYPGQARWVTTTTSSSATAQANVILAQMRA